MKRRILASILSAALLLLLAGCGVAPAATGNTPTPQTQVTPETPNPTPDESTDEPSVTTAPVIDTGRQDGERFESVINMEGMEETVRYEHVVNRTAGFEMDYDYESFLRQSEGDRERFLSIWDDPENPENYLEVKYDTGNAELVAEVISSALSDEYDVFSEYRELDFAGRCIYLEASALKGTNQMAEQLQSIYVIPASDGCRVATAHYSIESAEGFGRRFANMVNTLSVLDRDGDGLLTDEQALTAVRQYGVLGSPELERFAESGEYQVSWEVVDSNEEQIVVLLRSYTGAEVRYYIDRASGEAYVTEFVPGITPEEQRTEESLNVRDYLG